MKKELRTLLEPVYKSCNGPSDFARKAMSKTGKSKAYMMSLYYQFKEESPSSMLNRKSNNIITKNPVKKETASIPTPPSEPEPTPEVVDSDSDIESMVQELTPSNVETTSGQVLEEQNPLKRSYSKMLDEKGVDKSVLVSEEVEEKEPEPEPESSGIAASSGSSSKKSGNESRSGLTVNYGHALAYAIKGINNNLLFPERPLTADNEEMVDGIAQDVRTRRFTEMEMDDEDADIKMMLLAQGIITLERIDLIPDKVMGLARWVREFQAEIQGGMVVRTPNDFKNVQPQSQPSQSPPPEPKKEETDLSKYPPNVQAWMQDIINQGGKVSPYYQSGSAIDYSALTGRNILRNIGDQWGN
jgi:hypothetical protein